MKTLLALAMLLSVSTVLPVLCQTPQMNVETEIAVIKTEIKNLNQKIDDKFASFEKNLDRQNNIIIACIGIPFAILAICATVWGLLANRRNRKNQTLEKQIETLTQEIETLKQQLENDSEQKKIQDEQKQTYPLEIDEYVHLEDEFLPEYVDLEDDGKGASETVADDPEAYAPEAYDPENVIIGEGDPLGAETGEGDDIDSESLHETTNSRLNTYRSYFGEDADAESLGLSDPGATENSDIPSIKSKPDEEPLLFTGAVGAAIGGSSGRLASSWLKAIEDKGGSVYTAATKLTDLAAQAEQLPEGSAERDSADAEIEKAFGELLESVAPGIATPPTTTADGQTQQDSKYIADENERNAVYRRRLGAFLNVARDIHFRGGETNMEEFQAQIQAIRALAEKRLGGSMDPLRPNKNAETAPEQQQQQQTQPDQPSESEQQFLSQFSGGFQYVVVAIADTVIQRRAYKADELVDISSEIIRSLPTGHLESLPEYDADVDNPHAEIESLLDSAADDLLEIRVYGTEVRPLQHQSQETAQDQQTQQPIVTEFKVHTPESVLADIENSYEGGDLTDEEQELLDELFEMVASVQSANQPDQSDDDFDDDGEFQSTDQSEGHQEDNENTDR